MNRDESPSRGDSSSDLSAASEAPVLTEKCTIVLSFDYHEHFRYGKHLNVVDNPSTSNSEDSSGDGVDSFKRVDFVCDSSKFNVFFVDLDRGTGWADLLKCFRTYEEAEQYARVQFKLRTGYDIRIEISDDKFRTEEITLTDKQEAKWERDHERSWQKEQCQGISIFALAIVNGSTEDTKMQLLADDIWTL